MASSCVTPRHERPTWRGIMHAVAFIIAVPAGVFLILRADHAASRVAAAIYAASLLLAFGASASYHRLARTDRSQRVLQRLDHSMIFVLIAGSYTPVCLLGLSAAWGIPLLCVVWSVALFGILLKQFAFARFRFLEYALYPALGWAAVVTLPALIHGLSTAEMSLLFTGGLLYTIGIPVLLTRRPNPWPRTFGYHEVWHTFTVAAGACHFATVGLLVA